LILEAAGGCAKPTGTLVCAIINKE